MAAAPSPDARPVFRLLAGIHCVVVLAGMLLIAERAVENDRVSQSLVLMLLCSVPVVLALGHLALTGRWIAGRNYRL